MKVIKMDKPKWELSLCEDAAGKELELTRFVNDTQGPVTIVINGSTLKRGVVAGGDWYCAMCDGEAAADVKTIRADRCGMEIRDGAFLHTYGASSTSIRGQGPEVCSGEVTLYEDGSVLIGDYRWPVSPDGYPFVHADDRVAVDSHGNLLLPEDAHQPKHKQFRYILARAEGQICITSDRSVFCQNRCRSEFAGEAVDVQALRYGYLVLTRDGRVHFSENGCWWEVIAENACAISGDVDIAIGYTNGEIEIFTYNKLKLGWMPVLRLELSGKEIAEVCVNSQMLAWKYTDGSHDVIRR